MSLHVVILAAGQGKRMKSGLPKVLQTLAGRPLLQHILTTAAQLNPKAIYVIYGHGGQQVKQYFAARNDITWIEQAQQLGTGHAVSQVLPYLPNDAQVLVLPGDVPLISPQSLQALLSTTPSQGLGVLTVEMKNPAGLGRIVRNNTGQMIAIVEDKDATAEQHTIHEINTAIMTTSSGNLHRWLPRLENRNQQAEYYFTDIVPLAIKENLSVITVSAPSEEEVKGVNDKLQLIALERYYQQQLAQKFLTEGVSIIDPARFDLRGELQVGQDVLIDINVVLEGKVSIGNNCIIEPNSILRNVNLANHVHIKANSIIEDACIGSHCVIGPFARIRPGSQLGPGVHIGNFVEVKNTIIGSGSKANHLTYLGDADIGKNTNIGAGTITCNYDGAYKHRTHIGDNVSIGSDTQLIAPVTINDGATIGAGSTITKEAPAHTLTLSRAKQQSISGWQRPIKPSSEEQ